MIESEVADLEATIDLLSESHDSELSSEAQTKLEKLGKDLADIEFALVELHGLVPDESGFVKLSIAGFDIL